MQLSKTHSASLFLLFVTLGYTISSAGCGGTSETSQKPIGESAPGEFDQLELKVNGKDALDGNMVLPVGERFQVSGEFRFVKPYKEHAPFGSILVTLKWAEEGKRPGTRAGSANLKFIGNRKATFSCELGKPHKAGEYTLTVAGRRKIVMEAKVLVE